MLEKAGSSTSGILFFLEKVRDVFRLWSEHPYLAERPEIGGNTQLVGTSPMLLQAVPSSPFFLLSWNNCSLGPSCPPYLNLFPGNKHRNLSDTCSHATSTSFLSSSSGVPPPARCGSPSWHSCFHGLCDWASAAPSHAGTGSQGSRTELQTKHKSVSSHRNKILGGMALHRGENIFYFVCVCVCSTMFNTQCLYRGMRSLA